MSAFRARPYVEIAAARKAAILAGAKIIPKGACHFCAFPFQKREIWCSALCAEEYAAEVKELAAKAGNAGPAP